MRYVDIDQLELPDGWQARADQALNSLRAEIARAEDDARAAGKDANEVAIARKKAISDGLKISTRECIWRDLSTKLSDLSNGKCWYSESRNPMADKNVDHFRPKNSPLEDDSHDGYWWLAFDWRNYRYVSQWCNQYRNDKRNNTYGGKKNHFPLLIGSSRAYFETDDIDQEEIKLLDPTDPEDWKLLTFLPNGYPTPANPEGTPEYDRAITSINIYHLHCKELVNDRKPLARRVQRVVEEMEGLRPNLSQPPMRSFYKRQLKELLRLIKKDAEYSAAALAYARAEIYTLRCGKQVEREWLKEVLDGDT